MKKALFSREKGLNPMLTLFSILFFFFCFSWQKAEAQTPKIPQIPLCINELSPWSFVDPANPDVHYEWWTVDPDWAFFGLTDSMGTDTMHFISVYEKLSNPFAINQKEDIVVFVREAGSTTPAQQFTLEKGKQNGWCIISGKDQVCPGETKVRYDIDRGILTEPSLSITYNWTNSGQGQSYSVGFAENSQDNFFYFTAVAECVKGVYDVVLQLNFGSSSNPDPYFFPAVCPSYCSYAINVSDTNPPVIVHPDDIYWECFDEGKFDELVAEWEAEINDINGSIYSVDDCLPTGPDRHITVTTAVPDAEVIANNSTFTAKVYFTATDYCENIGIDSTVFYINMTAVPKPVVEVTDSTLYFECMPVGGFNPIPNFTVEDTCGRELTYVLTSDTTYNNCSYNADLEYIERINFYFTYTALNAEEWVWKKTYISKTHVNLPVAEVRDTVPCRADLGNEYTKLPIVKELCFDQEITPTQVADRLYQGTTPAGVDTIVESRFEYVDCAGNIDTLSYLRYVILPDTIYDAPDTVKITLACIADTTANYKIADIIDTLIANYTVTDYCGTVLEPEWVSSEDKTEGCIGTFEQKFKYENHNGYSVPTIFQITLNPYQFTIGKDKTFTTEVNCADSVKGHTETEALTWLDLSVICVENVSVAISGPVGVASTTYDTVLQYMYVFSVDCTNQKDTVWENVSLDRDLVITLNPNGTIACPKDSAWTNAGFAMTINEMDCIGEFEVDSVITVRNSGNCPAFVDYSFTVTNNSVYGNFLYNGDKVSSVTVTYTDTVKGGDLVIPADFTMPAVKCFNAYHSVSAVTDSLMKKPAVVNCDTVKPEHANRIHTYNPVGGCAGYITDYFAYADCYGNKDTVRVITPVIGDTIFKFNPNTTRDTVYCFKHINNDTPPTGYTVCGEMPTFSRIDTVWATGEGDIDTMVTYRWRSVDCGGNADTLTRNIYLYKPLVVVDSGYVVNCLSNSNRPIEKYLKDLLLAIDPCSELSANFLSTDTINTEGEPYTKGDCAFMVKHSFTIYDKNLPKSVVWSKVDTIKRKAFTSVPDTLKFFPTCLSELDQMPKGIEDTLKKLAYKDACGDLLKFTGVEDFNESEFNEDYCTGYGNLKVAYEDCSNNRDTLVLHFRMDYKPLHLHDSLNRTFTVDCVDDATLKNAYTLHRNKDAANMIDACGQPLDSVDAYTGTSSLNACGKGTAPFYFIYEDCAGHRDTVTITLTKTEPWIENDSRIVDLIFCDEQDTTTLTYRQVVDAFDVEFYYGCNLDTILVSVDETISEDSVIRVYTLTQGCADTVELTQELIFFDSAFIFTPTHYCSDEPSGDITLSMNPKYSFYNINDLNIYIKDNQEGEYGAFTLGDYFNYFYDLPAGTYYIKYHDIHHPECLFYDTVTILNLENVEVELPQGGNPCTQMNVIPLTTVELEAKQISSPFDVTAYYAITANEIYYSTIDEEYRIRYNVTLYRDSILIPGTTAPDTTIKWKLDMAKTDLLISSYNTDYSEEYFFNYRLILTGAEIKDIEGGCTLTPNDSIICLIPTCPEDQGPGSDYFTLICPNDTIVEIPWSFCEYTYCFEDDMGIPTYSSYVDKVVNGLEDDDDIRFVYFRTIEEIENDISSIDTFLYYYNYYTEEEPMITTFAPGEHTVYVYGYFYVKGCEFFDECEYKIFVTFKPCGDNDHYISGIDENREAIYGLPEPTYAIDFEQNAYPTVLIDCNCWTAENLRSMFYQDGATVDTFYEYYTDVNLNLDHELPNPEKWGLLYNWNTASRYQTTDDFNRISGICPEGWYLPSLANYTSLVKYGGVALSSETVWLGVDNTTNTTGFAALPAGYYNELARSFYYLLGDAYFWTANRYGLEMAWVAHIHFDCSDLLLEGFEQHRGASVRCIKNEPDPCNDAPAIVDWPAKIELDCEAVDFAIEIQANAKRRQNALLKVQLNPVTTADDILLQRMVSENEWDYVIDFNEGVAYINARDMVNVGLSDMIENYRIRINADIEESYNATMSWSIVDAENVEEVWTMVKTTELTISEITVPTVDFEFAVDTPFTFGCDSFPFKAIINLGNCNETDELYIEFGEYSDIMEFYYSFDSTSWSLFNYGDGLMIPVEDEDTVYFYLKNVNVEPGNKLWLYYELINGTTGYFKEIIYVETTPGDTVLMWASAESQGGESTVPVFTYEPDTFYVHVDATCYDGHGLVKIELTPNVAPYIQLEYQNYNDESEWRTINFDENGVSWFDRGFGEPFRVMNTVVPIRATQLYCSPYDEGEISLTMYDEDSVEAITETYLIDFILHKDDKVEMTLLNALTDDNNSMPDPLPLTTDYDTFYVKVIPGDCIFSDGLVKIDLNPAIAQHLSLQYLQTYQGADTWVTLEFEGDSLAWFDGGAVNGFPVIADTVMVRIKQTECYPDSVGDETITFVLVNADDSTTTLSDPITQELAFFKVGTPTMTIQSGENSDIGCNDTVHFKAFIDFNCVTSPPDIYVAVTTTAEDAIKLYYSEDSITWELYSFDPEFTIPVEERYDTLYFYVVNGGSTEDANPSLTFYLRSDEEQLATIWIPQFDIPAKLANLTVESFPEQVALLADTFTVSVTPPTLCPLENAICEIQLSDDILDAQNNVSLRLEYLDTCQNPAGEWKNVRFLFDGFALIGYCDANGFDLSNELELTFRISNTSQNASALGDYYLQFTMLDRQTGLRDISNIVKKEFELASAFTPREVCSDCVGTESVTDIDGNEYQARTMPDGRVWMIENLRTTRYFNNVDIPEITTGSPFTPYFVKPSKMGHPDNDTLWGYYYNWAAAVGAPVGTSGVDYTPTPDDNGHIQGVCPAGWHLPSDAEFIALKDSTWKKVSTTDSSAIYMTCPSGWKEGSLLDTNASPNRNYTCFSAVPTGNYSDELKNIDESVQFQCSFPYYNNAARRYAFNSSHYIMLPGAATNSLGLSVRCVKDYEVSMVFSCPFSGDTAVLQNNETTYKHSSNSWDATATPETTTLQYKLSGATTTDDYVTGSLHNVSFNPGETTVKWKATLGTKADSCSFTVKVGAVGGCSDCYGETTVTDIDGNEYQARTMPDGRVWMIENLRTTRYANENEIPEITTGAPNTPYFIKPSEMGYTDNDKLWGYYYNWAAAVGAPQGTSGVDYTPTPDDNGHIRGVCPAGWHLPSQAEFTALKDSTWKKVSTLDSSAIYMTCPSGWEEGSLLDTNTSPNRNYTCFSAVPAGYYINGNVPNSNNAYFWSATPYNDLFAIYYCLQSSNLNMYYNVSALSNGLSVRCVKDYEVPKPPKVDTIKHTFEDDEHSFTFTFSSEIKEPVQVVISCNGLAYSSITYVPTIEGVQTTNCSHSPIPESLTGDIIFGTSNGIEVTDNTLTVGFKCNSLNCPKIEGNWKVDVRKFDNEESLLSEEILKGNLNKGSFSVNSTKPITLTDSVISIEYPEQGDAHHTFTINATAAIERPVIVVLTFDGNQENSSSDFHIYVNESEILHDDIFPQSSTNNIGEGNSMYIGYEEGVYFDGNQLIIEIIADDPESGNPHLTGRYTFDILDYASEKSILSKSATGTQGGFHGGE